MKALPARCFRTALVAACTAAVALSWSTAARAEYAENFMGRDFALLTLATAGTISLGFDIGSTVYVARGPGNQAGRIVTGVGSVAGGCAVIAGGVLALSIVGEDHVPGQADTGPEADALRTARVLSGIDIGFGAASIGIGVASLVTFRPRPAPVSGALGWSLVPVAVSRGGGLGIVVRL